MAASFHKRSVSKITANLQQVKAVNQKVLFNLIYQYAPLSRADLTAKTQLSPTTVSSLVDELIKRGLVVNKGTKKTQASGRKPMMLEIAPLGGYVMSAELLCEGVYIAVYDVFCHEIGSIMEPIQDYADAGRCIIQAVAQLLEKFHLPEQRLWGLCLGVPGLIDPKRGVVTNSTIIPIHEDNLFLHMIRSHFTNIPVVLENESSLSAYAEKEIGNNAGLRNLIYIDINVGIGSGIIFDGRLLRGSDGLAGEIGHLSVDLNGPKCLCGNRGCLERMANVPALIQRVVYGMMSGRPTKITALTGGDYNRINIHVLREAALDHDELTLEAIDETARILAAGISSVLNLLNPQAVILGGDMTELGDILLSRIDHYVSQSALKASVGGKAGNIYYSQIKGNAATLGGAKLLLDNLIKNTRLETFSSDFGS